MGWRLFRVKIPPMIWANLLHLYQPPNQQKDILEKVVRESYRPLLQGFLDHPRAVATLNVNGVLLEMWEKYGHGELIEMLRELLRRGQLELTGSAKFHALLPLLPEDEVRRQIRLNEETLKRYFPDIALKVFFPPELAYSPKLSQIVARMGYEWIGVAQVAYGKGKPRSDRIYKDANSGLKIFFRDKRLSVLILSGYAHSWDSLVEEIPDYFEGQRYVVTVMDAETFGHHHPGLEDFLFEIYRRAESGEEPCFRPVKVSELVEYFEVGEEVKPRASTWSNTEQDFWLNKEQHRVRRNPFLLWRDPGNLLHHLQWKFVNWTISQVKKAGEPTRARQLLDAALASDQFWWASAKPWWSLEMIEQGAYALKEVINALPDVSLRQRRQAERYYRGIIDLAFEWQRTGKIRQMQHEEGGGWRKIPFKKRASEDEYKQFILEFEDEMWKAARKMEFEKAIKWRDAIVKLKKGTDIGEVFHVVDQLWAARKRIPQLKNWRDYSDEELSEFVKDAFKKWED